MILTLTKLFINRLDTGEAISAQTGRDRSQSWSTAAEVRTFANGRQRAFSVAGERGSIPYTLIEVSQATKDLLRQWSTEVASVQVRDNRGQKWFGVFGEVDVAERMNTDLYMVSFVLRTVSAVEGV